MAHLQETLHMAHGTWHIAHGTFTRHYAHGRRHHAHGTSTRHDAHGTYTRHHAHCTRHHAHGIGPISPSTGRLMFGVLARKLLDCLLSFRCDLAVDPTTDLLTPRRTPFPWAARDGVWVCLWACVRAFISPSTSQSSEAQKERKKVVQEWMK